MTDEELRKDLREAIEKFTGRYDEDVEDIIVVLKKHELGRWATSEDLQGSIYKPIK